MRWGRFESCQQNRIWSQNSLELSSFVTGASTSQLLSIHTYSITTTMQLKPHFVVKCTLRFQISHLTPIKYLISPTLSSHSILLVIDKYLNEIETILRALQLNRINHFLTKENQFLIFSFALDMCSFSPNGSDFAL